MQKTKALFALLSVLAPAAMLCACSAPKEAAAPAETVTSAVTAAPTPAATEEPVLFSVRETPSPVPLTPEPTAVPTPTPEPDPYTDGMEKTVYCDGFYYVELNDALKERISGLSYPANPRSCRVSYDELRYLRIRYVDFEGAEHTGELIVHATLADEVLEIFKKLYDARYPLTSVRLVDDFGEPADDTKSMEADNTSSFCHRKVTGTSKLSRHSYGAAIDINPRENPYIRSDGSVSPKNSKPYLDRKQDFPGKIDHSDYAYEVFTSYGWEWGGDFKGNKDYQHFSKAVDR